MKRMITYLMIVLMAFAAAFCTPVLAAEAEDANVSLEFHDAGNAAQITALQLQAKVGNVPENAAVSLSFAERLSEKKQVIARSTYHDGVLTVYLASNQTLLAENETKLPLGDIVINGGSGDTVTLELIPESLECLNGTGDTVDLPSNGVRLISSAADAAGTTPSEGGETAAAVNKDRLNTLIEECEKLQKADYTDDSWEDFHQALEAAKTVAANANATQKEVDDALTALLDAYDRLHHATVTGQITNETTKEGIRKALEELLKELDDLVSSDYTDDSWNTLYELMKQARELLQSDDASPEELKEILDQLRQSQSALVQKDAADNTADTAVQTEGEKGNAPQTGDSRHPILWIAIGSVGGAIALAVIIVIYIWKKKS